MRMRLEKSSNALVLVFESQQEALELMRDLAKGVSEIKSYPMALCMPFPGCVLNDAQKKALAYKTLHASSHE